VIDTREQAPFAFAGLRTDARDGARPLTVPTVRAGLPSGDYSLSGHETRVAVERKSLEDLYGTLGHGRRRFERELQRLSAYELAEVVVEAGWDVVLMSPPERSRLRPKTVFRSVLAWKVRYPTVHWTFCPGRRFAEVWTFRLLERWWKVHNGAALGAGIREVPF